MKAKQLTRLLHQWRHGNATALDELTPIIYEDLRRIASRHLNSERKNHTLQATALVNEAFLRISESDVAWQDRAHFFAVAATLMRRILVDYGRARSSKKRQAMASAITLNEELVSTQLPSTIFELESALNKLEKIDQRKSTVLVMFYYGGMTYTEMSEALNVSKATIARELEFAKGWLKNELKN